jgi:hypothetical protein
MRFVQGPTGSLAETAAPLARRLVLGACRGFVSSRCNGGPKNKRVPDGLELERTRHSCFYHRLQCRQSDCVRYGVLVVARQIRRQRRFSSLVSR